MAGSLHLWRSPRIKTLEEIDWERKETRKRRFRRLSLVVLYALIFVLFLI